MSNFLPPLERFHFQMGHGTGAALVPAALRLPPPVFLTRFRRCVVSSYANTAIVGIGETQKCVPLHGNVSNILPPLARFHINLVHGTGAALVPSALRLPPPVFLMRLRRCVGNDYANTDVASIVSIAIGGLPAIVIMT